MSDEMEDLRLVAGRLENLEKQNRWMKNAGLAVLALAGCFFLMAQALPASGTIEAQEFTLRDKAGNVRGRLGMNEAGPFLSLNDATGIDRVGLVAGKDGPVLVLRSGKDKIQAQLAVVDGIPWLSLLDATERERAILVVNDVKGPLLKMYDATGRTIFSRPWTAR